MEESCGKMQVSILRHKHVLINVPLYNMDIMSRNIVPRTWRTDGGTVQFLSRLVIIRCAHVYDRSYINTRTAEFFIHIYSTTTWIQQPQNNNKKVDIVEWVNVPRRRSSSFKITTPHTPSPLSRLVRSWRTDHSLRPPPWLSSKQRARRGVQVQKRRSPPYVHNTLGSSAIIVLCCVVCTCRCGRAKYTSSSL